VIWPAWARLGVEWTGGVRQALAWQGRAGLRPVRLGKDWLGEAMRGSESRGLASFGGARIGRARLGGDRLGEVRTRRESVWPGAARCGMVRYG